MSDKKIIDAMWDDSPIDVSTEVNFIWSIANKLRGPYRSDKYKDVIIPMTIIRRFECALAPTKQKVVDQFKANPNFPAKAMYRISGFQFYNTSEFDLAELVNDADHIAANFKSYLQGFSANVLEILMSKERGLNFGEEIDKMDKNNRLLSVIKAFSELDLNPRTIDNVKMGYIFEELIRKFSENAEAGDHYTGRDIIKLMVNILLAEGCDDIFDDGKVITILDQACGTGGMLSTGYNFIKRYNPSADVRLFGQEINPESYAILAGYLKTFVVCCVAKRGDSIWQNEDRRATAWYESAMTGGGKAASLSVTKRTAIRFTAMCLPEHKRS